MTTAQEYHARTRARRAALQALYQWYMGGQDVTDIEVQFFQEQDMAHTDRAYFRELLHGITARAGTLDDGIAHTLQRPMAQVDPVERTALRIGAYELEFHPEIPYQVVINEAVELAKRFGGAEGHRFVNAAMDRLATTVRPVEVNARRNSRSA